MSTPRFQFPYITQGQAQKEVTHNEGLVQIDALNNAYFLDRDLATPPGSPVDGDCYLVAASPTGAWSGQAGKIAYRIDGAWRFYTVGKGMIAYVVDEDLLLRFNGTSWAALAYDANVSKINVAETWTATKTTQALKPSANNTYALGESGASYSELWLGGIRFRGWSVSIADDAVATLSLNANVTGSARIRSNVTSTSGIGMIDTVGTNAFTKEAGGASFTASTGALTGTSGVDGQITVSVSSNTLYLENRGGSTLSFRSVVED